MKKKPDRYIYPAVFSYEPGEEISVVFPDLDVATSGVDDDDALLSARELLGITLFGLEEDGEDIPAPSRLNAVQLSARQPLSQPPRHAPRMAQRCRAGA